jgi:hypothetical protein
MGKLSKSQAVFVIAVSIAFLQVSFAKEESKDDSAEYYSESFEWSPENDHSNEEQDQWQISLHGDTDVNNFVGFQMQPNSEEVEPLFYQSDEVVEGDYSAEAEETQAGQDRSGGKPESDVDSSSFEITVVKATENGTTEGSVAKTNPEIDPVNSNASAPAVDVAPALDLVPALEDAPTPNVTPIVDVAPALNLVPAELTKTEDAPTNEFPIDASVLTEDDQKLKDENVEVELEIIPNGVNPSLPKTEEAAIEEEISEDLNRLEKELRDFTNPRYASVARNHRVLLTSIIIGFFALSIATVLFTFYRGFIVFTRVVRRRSGVNYRRMEEEQDQDSHASPVLFQEKV